MVSEHALSLVHFQPDMSRKSYGLFVTKENALTSQDSLLNQILGSISAKEKVSGP